jgi:undecaprenyl-diphosphatase
MKSFLYTGAAIVALSRVMCGVHYPFDILAGALIGMIFAMLVIYLWTLIEYKMHQNGQMKKGQQI